MKQLTMNVTGHRQLNGHYINGPNDKDGRKIIESIKGVVNRFYTIHGFRFYVSGMALGGDMVFAQAVIELRRDGLPIELEAAMPYACQASFWRGNVVNWYKDILSKCDSFCYVSPDPTGPTEAARRYDAIKKLDFRNQYMVNKSLVTLGIYSKDKTGGTKNCLDYARSQGNFITIVDADSHNPYDVSTSIHEFKRGTEDEMYSNFYMKMQPLQHQDISYATSEHLYMALKTTDVNARRSISNMAYPGHVKKWCSPKSGNIILRPGWDKMIKFQAMEYALRQKFSQPILAAKYIKDFPKELQEGNQWHDVCWV